MMLDKRNDGQVPEIKRKNRNKKIRTCFQLLFCLIIISCLIKVLCFPSVYQMPDKSEWTQTDGFLTLSYVGVSNRENATLVSKKKLDQHLKALSEAGYVTIDIDDVINFYENDAPLPDKALLLIFEDGRKDSLLYAQPLLEKYNYKAVMMTYAYNVVNKDRLFLKAKNLKKMEESTYWDIGSNGYRFSYINVKTVLDDLEDRDQDGKYHKEEVEYNHYLMDYLRDQDGVPTESKQEMINRISWDYDQMNEIYTNALNNSVKPYMIMHANSLFGNMNDVVEKVNLEKIYEYFPLLFNREGSCYNTDETSLYNLTRMQVGADWSVNKLLMEIENWTSSGVPFVVGDEEAMSRWQVKEGVMEIDETALILTAPKQGKAFAYLKGSDQNQDLELSTYLAGREFGTQTIYLRYDEQKGSFVQLSLLENRLTIAQRTADGTKEILYSQLMPDADELPEYDDQFDTTRIEDHKIESDTLTLEGINLKQQLHRKYKVNASHMASPISWALAIHLEDQVLTVAIGGNVILEVEIDASINSGGVALEASGKDAEIYDGLFDELIIEPLVRE